MQQFKKPLAKSFNWRQLDIPFFASYQLVRFLSFSLSLSLSLSLFSLFSKKRKLFINRVDAS